MRRILLVTIVILSACTTSSKIISKMNDDERIFKSNCIACHSLPDSKSKSDEQWASILDDHSKRTKISKEKINIILNYLIKNN